MPSIVKFIPTVGEIFTVNGQCRQLKIENNGDLSVWYMDGANPQRYIVIENGSLHPGTKSWHEAGKPESQGLPLDTVYQELLDTQILPNGKVLHLVGHYSLEFLIAASPPPPTLDPENNTELETEE